MLPQTKIYLQSEPVLIHIIKLFRRNFIARLISFNKIKSLNIEVEQGEGRVINKMIQ